MELVVRYQGRPQCRPHHRGGRRDPSPSSWCPRHSSTTTSRRHRQRGGPSTPPVLLAEVDHPGPPRHRSPPGCWSAQRPPDHPYPPRVGPAHRPLLGKDNFGHHQAGDRPGPTPTKSSRVGLRVQDLSDPKIFRRSSRSRSKGEERRPGQRCTTVCRCRRNRDMRTTSTSWPPGSPDGGRHGGPAPRASTAAPTCCWRGHRPRSGPRPREPIRS